LGCVEVVVELAGLLLADAFEVVADFRPRVSLLLVAIDLLPTNQDIEFWFLPEHMFVNRRRGFVTVR
jgi:hypothetical protein